MTWVNDENAALLTDLYELTMLRAYLAEGMEGRAVFDLFVRYLPERRNFLLAGGQEAVLHYLESLVFDDADLEWIEAQPEFDAEFADRLAAFSFTGDVWAVPEGTPVFGNEPILTVEAPIAEAQIVETFLLNQITAATLLASKATRVVRAAAGRPVVDFGLRRMIGADAGVLGARAYHVAGLAGTSNVLAARLLGIPSAGTMAHAYIEAHDDEAEAFRAFADVFPETVLLVDTYDTAEGVRKVVRLAEELGDGFRVRGIRLDSGDLAALAREARAILDDAGLTGVKIYASGGLDEDSIAAIVASGAPVDAFGVGTRMGVSADAPTLDSAYKLAAYDGEGRMKLSPGKETLPYRKQVFRIEEDGRAVRDVIALADEAPPPGARPLLVKMMESGARTDAGRWSLDSARAHAAAELSRLPARVRDLPPAAPPYPVDVTPALAAARDDVRRNLKGQ